MTRNEYFQQCLVKGMDSEDEFREVLLDMSKKGTTVTRLTGHNPLYDLMLVYKTIIRTYEVKTDEQACMTGNVAIEISKKVKGVVQNSGLSVTTADFYVYKLFRYPNFLQISTKKLKKLVEEGKIKRLTQGGDNDESTCVLMDKEFFISQCEQIPRKVLKEMEFKRPKY